MGMGRPRTCRMYSLALLVAVVGAGGCGVNLGGPRVQGSGVLKTETRDVSGFEQIEVSGAIRLEYSAGKETAVEVSTDENLLPLFVTDVSGDTLKVSMRGSTSTSLGTTVKVSAPRLKGLTVRGASSATLSGLETKNLRVKVSGASEVTASGTADRLDIDCAGASHVYAKKLTAQTVVVSVSGASGAEVHAAKELDAQASGASTVRYTGSPATTKQGSSGASSISGE
jgi:hypothetical protein